MKGDSLNFECSTSDSNPPVDIWWVVDGRAVQVRQKIGSSELGEKVYPLPKESFETSYRNLALSLFYS